MCHLIGVTRPGYHLSGDHLPPEIVTLLDVPAMAISSSAVRERVRSSRPIWYLVPDGVVQYIGKHALYAEASRPLPYRASVPSGDARPVRTRPKPISSL